MTLWQENYFELKALENRIVFFLNSLICLKAELPPKNSNFIKPLPGSNQGRLTLIIRHCLRTVTSPIYSPKVCLPPFLPLLGWYINPKFESSP